MYPLFFRTDYDVLELFQMQIFLTLSINYTKKIITQKEQKVTEYKREGRILSTHLQLTLE
jgi:hypothetical protein